MTGETPLPLRRLLPEAGEATAGECAAGLAYPHREDRPHVVLNMVVTVDGHVTVAGRSGSLGNRADRELFRALRTTVDAVMVGAGTVRTERYGPLIRDPELRAQRVKRGLEPQPLAVIPTRGLDLPPDLPLLADPDSRVLVLTTAEAEIADAAAEMRYMRFAPGALDMPSALRQLRGLGVRSVLCEGGPHLNATLLGAGLVDELFVSFSPQLAGGEALTMISGPPLAETVALTLIWLLESEGHLFARYAVSRASD